MTEETTVLVQKSHSERHPNDAAPPKGFVRVRIDGDDSTVKPEARIYALVPAGYGEGKRVKQVRERGLVNGEPVVLIGNTGEPFGTI